MKRGGRPPSIWRPWWATSKRTWDLYSCRVCGIRRGTFTEIPEFERKRICDTCLTGPTTYTAYPDTYGYNSFCWRYEGPRDKVTSVVFSEVAEECRICMKIIHPETWHCAYCVARGFDQGQNSIDEVLDVVCRSEDGVTVAGPRTQAAEPSLSAGPPSGAGPSPWPGPSPRTGTANQSVTQASQASHGALEMDRATEQTRTNVEASDNNRRDKDGHDWDNLEEINEPEEAGARREA